MWKHIRVDVLNIMSFWVLSFPVDQIANVVLYSNDSYAKCVDIEDSG